MTFLAYIYIIGKENKRKKQNVVATNLRKKEVARMVEKYILQLLILSLFGNVAFAIISFILIIVLTIKMQIRFIALSLSPQKCFNNFDPNSKQDR